MIWATGGGATNNPDPDGSITGVSVFPLQLTLAVGTGFPGALGTGPAPNSVPPIIQYSGDAPGMVKGVIQVNFQLPLVESAGPAEFYLQVGGQVSDPFTIYLK